MYTGFLFTLATFLRPTAQERPPFLRGFEVYGVFGILCNSMGLSSRNPACLSEITTTTKNKNKIQCRNLLSQYLYPFSPK